MNSKKLLISITAIIGMTLLDYKEIRAQTCSGANVSVGSGQNCNDVTLTINPSTLTTSGTGTIRNSVNSKAVFVNGVTANINNNGSILGSSTSAID